MVAPSSKAASRSVREASSMNTASGGSSSGRRGRVSPISKCSQEEIGAARQRLEVYLQHNGISRAQAVQLAGELSAQLGAAADQLVPAPLSWLVGRGMRPLRAAELVAHMCHRTRDPSCIRHWPAWQPSWEASWQLIDSQLAAYQQRCKQARQMPVKHGASMAAHLSGMPSRYILLLAPNLASKVQLVQRQLGLTSADVGQLVAGGLMLTGREETTAAAIQWLVRTGGSQEEAASLLRLAPTLLSCSAAVLDSKLAALHAVWAGTLQPEQVRQLVRRVPALLASRRADGYAPTAAVLTSWFLQPDELLAVLLTAPGLLMTPAGSLQASQRWLMRPSLGLSRKQFSELVRAAPQAFVMNLAAPLAQRKLEFLTQVGGVPLEQALSKSHLNYLKSSLTALAGRFFLLTEQGVPLLRHTDGGITLTYVIEGLPHLLCRMRAHDSKQRLPSDDDAALEYLRQWLADWPETESGRQWAKPPAAAAAGEA